MFTAKDIETRTLFVINCIENERNLRVKNGELLLEGTAGESNKTLTKFPFQKILALFIVGHITVTTPLIDKCKKFNVALVVVKPNLRPVFYWANSAEGNFLLRKRQYALDTDDISVAKVIVGNKIENQLLNLRKTRKKDEKTLEAIAHCEAALNTIADIGEYNTLLGMEGLVSRLFYSAYFQDLNWQGRKPRVKCDVLNVTLDMGYTILFNFIECFARMFGFDLFIGVYHRLWFKRKSLICDLMEPFRSIIDHTTLLAFKKKQFKIDDFIVLKSEYRLKYNKNADYHKVFYDALIDRKMDVFKYIQTYYRCFMGGKSTSLYPKFLI